MTTQEARGASIRFALGVGDAPESVATQSGPAAAPESSASPKPKRRRSDGNRKRTDSNEQAVSGKDDTAAGAGAPVEAKATQKRTTTPRGRGRGRRSRITETGELEGPQSEAAYRRPRGRGGRTAGAQRHARGGRTAAPAPGSGYRAETALDKDSEERAPEQGSLSQFVLLGDDAEQVLGDLKPDAADLDTSIDSDLLDGIDAQVFPEYSAILSNPLAKPERSEHEFRSFRELTNEQFEMLTEAQKERYVEFRRAALRPQNLRRFVNALVGGASGYAPGHPFLIALQGLGKMFVGDLVETAVQIKCEWDRNREIATRGEAVHASPIGPDGALLTPLEPRHIREAYRRLQKQGHLFTVLYGGSNQAAGHAPPESPHGLLAL
jgi:hypothetical protein